MILQKRLTMLNETLVLFGHTSRTDHQGPNRSKVFTRILCVRSFFCFCIITYFAYVDVLNADSTGFELLDVRVLKHWGCLRRTAPLRLVALHLTFVDCQVDRCLL